METRVCVLLASICIVLGTACEAGQPSVQLDVNEVARSARDIPSIYLTPEEKEDVVRIFLKLVSIRSPSGQEGAIRDILRKDMTALQAVEIARDDRSADTPCNLVMEFRASGRDADKPGILLNAHLDTIDTSAPEQLRFDAANRDLYHADGGTTGKPSSFGADDKAGIATILGSLSVLKHRLWSPDTPHRRVVVAFTAVEERGFVGARYLKEHHPEVFDNLEISLTFDGPLDFRTDYPASSFVVVVSPQDAQVQPYRRLIDLVTQVARKKDARFARTEMGLGMGDFAQFPASAHAGLHIRSPHRGLHRLERVKLADLINHVDLLCYILLEWERGELN